MSELAAVATDLKPDVIALVETWCHSEISSAVLAIDGYELIPDLRMDRIDTAGGRGGGLIVYIRSGKQILKIDKKLFYSQLCSFIIDDVTFNLVYRPPSAAAESVAELAKLLSESKRNEVFLGDFNLPTIDWVNGGGGRGREAVFAEAVEGAFMQQLVDFRTHIKGNILDLVVTNIPERVEELYDAGRLGKSDHVMLMVKISVGGEEEERQPLGKDWRRADWDELRREFQNRDWIHNIRHADAAAAWKLFSEKISEAINKCVPDRRRRNQNKPAWLNQNILREIRRKKRLWKAIRGGAITEEYRQAEKRVKNLIRNAKRSFEKKLADKNSSNRQFFAYVKKKTGSRSSVGPLKTGGGEAVADDQGMAEIFINDLDEAAAAVDILKKFADDTKLGHDVSDQTRCDELQKSLDGLVEWSHTWGMQFNVAKCKVMHLGNRNGKHVYTMAGQALGVTSAEKDIGVIVTDKLKPADQCRSAARTAQAVLGQITRAFHYRDRHVFVRLYKQYVRPHLEFSTQAWSPWNGEDIDCLEKVQQKAIKMVTGLRGRTYEERLEEL